jgi:putative ABC transport system permease protein
MCIVAIGIAVFFTIIFQSMISGMLGSINAVVQVFDTGHINITSKEYQAEKEYMPVQYPVTLPGGDVYTGTDVADLRTAIGAAPGVKAVFPRILSYATLQDTTAKHALLVGLEIEAETAVIHFNQSNKTDGLVEGRWPGDANECAVGKSMAANNGLKIGDKIPLKTVSAQFSDKMWAPVITGIFDFDYLKYDKEAIFVDFHRLERLLTLEGGTQQLFVFLDDPGRSREVSAQLTGILGEDASVNDWQDNYFVMVMQQSMAIFIVMEFVFMLVASFLIINTVVMIIYERIKEIGMMGSLGMTRGEIVRVFFLESFFLAVLGSLAGVILGGTATGILSFFPLNFNTFTGGGFEEFPMSGTIFWEFSPSILMYGFIFGVIVAGVCTLFPSLRSAFVEPVEALRR